MSVPGWVDGYTEYPIAGRPGLPFRAKIPLRITAHSTEGTTAYSAIAAYRGGTGPPHFTVDFPRRQKFQHIGLDKGAYALRNDYADGREANACPNIQIEIVGFAKDGDEKSFAELDWLGEVLAEIVQEARNIGLCDDTFDLVWPEFYDERSGFTLATKDAKQRDLYKDWNTGRWTLYGHQHIGDGNAHWDPGKINWVLVDRKFDSLFPAKKATTTVANLPDPPILQTTNTPLHPLTVYQWERLKKQDTAIRARMGRTEMAVKVIEEQLGRVEEKLDELLGFASGDDEAGALWDLRSADIEQEMVGLSKFRAALVTAVLNDVEV